MKGYELIQPKINYRKALSRTWSIGLGFKKQKMVVDANKLILVHMLFGWCEIEVHIKKGRIDVQREVAKGREKDGIINIDPASIRHLNVDTLIPMIDPRIREEMLARLLTMNQMIRDYMCADGHWVIKARVSAGQLLHPRREETLDRLNWVRI